MATFYVSCSILFVFCLTLFCNACLLQYNLYIIFAGAIIRTVSEMLDIVPASLLLIFSGLLLDALNFTSYFGGAAAIYLFFYGIYRYILENNKNFIENFPFVVVHSLNLVFIAYFAATQMTKPRALSLIPTVIFSQVMTYFLEKILSKISMFLFPKVDKNPFNIAQNFSKNSAL